MNKPQLENAINFFSDPVSLELDENCYMVRYLDDNIPPRIFSKETFDKLVSDTNEDHAMVAQLRIARNSLPHMNRLSTLESKLRVKRDNGFYKENEILPPGFIICPVTRGMINCEGYLDASKAFNVFVAYTAENNLQDEELEAFFSNEEFMRRAKKDLADYHSGKLKIEHTLEEKLISFGIEKQNIAQGSEVKNEISVEQEDRETVTQWLKEEGFTPSEIEASIELMGFKRKPFHEVAGDSGLDQAALYHDLKRQKLSEEEIYDAMVDMGVIQNAEPITPTRDSRMNKESPTGSRSATEPAVPENSSPARAKP